MVKNVIQEIRRSTRRQYGAEEKIRIVLEGLRGEISVAELCRRECRHCGKRITTWERSGG
jgi:5-methylcytosine-specific restriction endonuclease McrBC regulatory subunit McrC